MATTPPPNQPLPQQVTVTRTELPAPDISNPGRMIVQIQYQVGQLPPRFVYLPKDQYSKDAEAKLIKADMAKRLQAPGEIVTL